jgi:hypothetical protein
MSMFLYTYTFHPKYLPKYVLSMYYFFKYVHGILYTCAYCVYKILQGMLFYVVCLWERILCVCDMYVVVLQHYISAPIGVQHA